MKTFLFAVRCESCGMHIDYATVQVERVQDADKAMKAKARAVAGKTHKKHVLAIGMDVHSPELAAGELPQ